MDEWRSEILAGVDEISYGGSVPGVLLVCGDNAVAVLANSDGQVLCVAAELGAGRIIIFSHGFFVKNFSKTTHEKSMKRFYENIKNWVTRGFPNSKISEFSDHMKGMDKLKPEGNILTWKGRPKANEETVTQLKEWIKRGGGMVCGCCPWGYAKQFKVGVEDIPLNDLLHEVGTAFAGETYFKGSLLKVKDNLAHVAKLSDTLKVLKLEFEDKKHLHAIVNDHIEHLPESLYQRHVKSIEELVNQLSPGTSHVPTASYHVESPILKSITELKCNLLIRYGKTGVPVIAEEISHFPGHFRTTPELVSGEIEIEADCPRQFHSTGYYLPAGVVMEVTWYKNVQPWKLVIGQHGDKLYNVKKTLKRWPHIRIVKMLKSTEKEKEGSFNVSSPFGGLVYVQSTEKIKDKIYLQFTNILQSPKFTHDKAHLWDSERTKQGLLSDLVGHRIAFTFPSGSVRDLTDLHETMELWDKVVDALIDLLGKDPSDGRGQWLVADRQPKAGYMHSGYPIVTHLDITSKNNPGKFLFNKEDLLKNGRWGVFHELGHNFQDKQWTFSGTSEVTCNIFALHAMDVICGIKPWIHPWLQKHMKAVRDFFQNGAKYEKWTSTNGVALFVYAQLARDFGWNAYKEVFRTYNSLPKDKRPSTNQQRINMWITTFSKVVGKNLCPMFDLWGWPIKDGVLKELSKLPFHLPEDEITEEMASDRVVLLNNKYQTCKALDDENDENDETTNEADETCKGGGTKDDDENVDEENEKDDDGVSDDDCNLPEDNESKDFDLVNDSDQPTEDVSEKWCFIF